MKTCARCNNPRRKSGRYCLNCHAENMRIWRSMNKMTEEQRKKDNCRSYAGVYLRRGKIKKENCMVCGSEESQMHHDDYNKPLEITWLCRECHLKIHKNVLRETY